jgi:hypothetical protein
MQLQKTEEAKQARMEMQLRMEAARRRELDMARARKERQQASRLRASETSLDKKRASKMKHAEDTQAKIVVDTELAKEESWKLAQAQKVKLETKAAAVIKYDVAESEETF